MAFSRSPTLAQAFGMHCPELDIEHDCVQASCLQAHTLLWLASQDRQCFSLSFLWQIQAPGFRQDPVLHCLQTNSNFLKFLPFCSEYSGQHLTYIAGVIPTLLGLKRH
jgi:hypothetical protein